MEISRRCDMQELGSLMGLTVGMDIHDKIIPFVKKLLEAIKEIHAWRRHWKEVALHQGKIENILYPLEDTYDFELERANKTIQSKLFGIKILNFSNC